MDIAILQRELDELESIPTLFDEHNFRARKEALAFVDLVTRIKLENNTAQARLKEQARMLEKSLRDLNRSIAQDWRIRLKNERYTPQNLRAWLQAYTDYMPQEWGHPHYGYENLDFLLDEILLPFPRPEASLQRKLGMVRYESTPASVILELTERIIFSENDIFYDLGSGLGKVPTLVHLLSGVSCLGVEYQPDFCTYAAQQAHGLDLKGINYINADARHVDFSEATVFFLFNPFGGDIFTTVLERLRLEAQKRELWICSYGSSSQPLSEFLWLEPIPPINEDEAALALFHVCA